MNHYFMGVDIGTTSTKAIVFSSTGQLKGIGNIGYNILTPKPSWAEQEPEAIFTAVVAAIHEAIQQAGVLKSELAAVGFSAAMHSLIAVDSEGRLLTNAMIWADNRSVLQSQTLKQTGQAIYQRTGTPIHPMSPLTKLMWMREEAPDIFDQAAKFISIKEYIVYQLFRRYVVDYSIASATGLFNLKQLTWDQEALAVAGVRVDQLSEPVPTTYILQGLNLRDAEAMGLAAETPFVIGASDGVLANLGVGAIDKGRVAITIGTSSAIRTAVDVPLTDRQGRTFCYALTENRWIIGGPSNNGGIVLRWFRDQLSGPEVEASEKLGIDAYTLMIDAASKVPAGAQGLIFLPFLSGERAPYWNADARGTFFGLGLNHTRAHLIRAVLEGIIFCVYSIYSVLSDLSGEANALIVSGGFACSHFWRQLVADIFGAEVLLPEVFEGSSFGAAVLAMYAIDAIKSLEEGQRLISIREQHQPDPNLTPLYRELFSIYERVYTNMTTEFEQLAAFQKHFEASVK